ncbi:fused DSP-PTPase phosphatase/NAD kinase-like protein [Yunchengibacter salinarum]|uniref:fused DSP-PTPase phosphatase/NAD kinase-like protein n=1 Tax=Yunchengibacter salinarum TaxID=3133399 RepID=UPI0035B5B3E0
MTRLLSRLLLLGGLLIGGRGALAQAPDMDLDMSNAAMPLPGIITGGQPSRDDLKALADSGVKTVITLRTENEWTGMDEDAETSALGLRLIRIPVSGAEDLTPETARQLHAALTEVEAHGQVLLHCAAGNRAGGLLALRQFHFQDMSVDAAYDLGRKAGLSGLSRAVKKKLQQAEKKQ